MFDTHSDYALNKVDKEAIVCPCVTGEYIRLVKEGFSSEEEFLRWKKWSDDDYHETELASRKDDSCFSFEAQKDAPAPSAEDTLFLAAEAAERQCNILNLVRGRLTEKQYRRLCLYYLDKKTEAEIADIEGTTQQRISKSLIAGRKKVKKFLQIFLRNRG